MKAHVVAYWGPRPQTVEDCASRLADLLDSLAGISPLLARWRPGAGSKRAAMEQPVITSNYDELLERLLDGRVRRGDEVIENLGYSIALWNGSADSKASAGLSVRCGIHADNLSNSISLNLPQPSHEPAIYTPDHALMTISTIIRCWAPERAAWTNDALIAPQKEPVRETSDGGYILGQLIGQPAGWATYLANGTSDRFRETDLPASASIQQLDGGTLVVVGGDPVDPPLRDILAVRRAMGYEVRDLPPTAGQSSTPLSAPSDKGIAATSPTERRAGIPEQAPIERAQEKPNRETGSADSS